jgi:hypothetical protein
MYLPHYMVSHPRSSNLHIQISVAVSLMFISSWTFNTVICSGFFSTSMGSSTQNDLDLRFSG